MAATNGNESWVSFTIKCPPLDDSVEEIYEDLCYVTFSSSLPEVQNLNSFFIIHWPIYVVIQKYLSKFCFL